METRAKLSNRFEHAFAFRSPASVCFLWHALASVLQCRGLRKMPTLTVCDQDKKRGVMWKPEE